MNISIIAGEASGDRVGGQLARELLTLEPGVTLWGAGGKYLREAGVDVVLETSGFGVVGIASGLALLPKMVTARKRLLVELKKRKPDVIVAIDAGAVHLGFGPWEGILPWARKHLPNTKLFYYFPPGSWRRTLKYSTLGPVTDAVASPFEWNASELQRLGVNATWVGHPLLDLVKPSESMEAFATRYGLDLDHPIVGLLPGSRRQEIRHILPVQLQAASLIHRRVPGVQFVLALAPTVDRNEVVTCLERIRHQRIEQTDRHPGPKLPDNIVVADGSAEELVRRQRAWIERAGGEPGDGNFPLVIVEGATYDVMAVSDALISTSGTATLEAAILKKPMVIVYKLGPENAIEAHFVRKKVSMIGMPNLLAERIICPEFIQENCKPEPIAQEVIGLLLEPERLMAMRAALVETIKLLGEPGGAARAAKMVLELANRD
ncbi:MAG: hypothetical protein QM758_25850 [Armatimonas sp.]